MSNRNTGIRTTAQPDRLEEQPPPWSTQGQAEYERDLLRRIADMIEKWRSCRLTECRRQKGCASPLFLCLQVKDPVPLDSEIWARAQSELRRGLDRRLRESGRGR